MRRSRAVVTSAPLLSLQTLDFETKSSYVLRVEASNRYVDARFLSTGPFSDAATIRLLVENVDEPPVFSSSISQMVISEAAAVGTDVGSVLAHDPDATNSPIRYEHQLLNRDAVHRCAGFSTVLNLHAGTL